MAEIAGISVGIRCIPVVSQFDFGLTLCGSQVNQGKAPFEVLAAADFLQPEQSHIEIQRLT